MRGTANPACDGSIPSPASNKARRIMRKFISTLAVILSAVAVASCSVSAVEGVTKPGEQKGGLFGLVKQDDIKVDNDDALKGV